MPSENTIVHAELLIEFLTEELPPMNLEGHIGYTFATSLLNELKSFTDGDNTTPWFFVSPRRFGCTINNLRNIEPKQLSRKKGPAIATALKDEQPTPALSGFLKGCGMVDWHDLEQHSDGYFYAIKTIPGRMLTQILPTAIETALKKLPIAKHMRWGNNDYAFVRPVQNLVIMYNNQVICKDSIILGCSPVDYTFGHRIMSTNRIYISNSNDYAQQMQQVGHVIVDFQMRKQAILTQLEHKAGQLSLTINSMPGLLDEVTALVEHPVILHGEFAAEFLTVPQECLILSMAKNQKYFALLDKSGKLSNQFLFVANITSTHPEVIVNGNQKVLAARLSDAKFFYDTDLKHNLSDFVTKLESMIYHNKLGSQLQRIERLQQIAKKIAPLLGVDSQLARSTARILKADLTTEMVGEFPELQGVMGKYYALVNGESNEVANAIEKHYYPRFSGDELPDTTLAIIMSLTDKLETLIGIWGIGFVPTGEKDPFALRRTALGVIRILLDKDLNLDTLLGLTFATFNDELNLNSNTVSELKSFILQRLSNYLVHVMDYTPDLVQSILVQQPPKFNYIPSLLNSLQQFATNENNRLLLNANKRIKNILEKNEKLTTLGELFKEEQPKRELFQVDAETQLFNLFAQEDKNIINYSLAQKWEEYFAALAKFNQPVTDFFDNVMVMDNNENIRDNRIKLLQHLYSKFNLACSLAELN